MNYPQPQSATGLPGRIECTQTLDALLRPQQNVLNRVVVLWLDLDRFVGINRSLGHRAGDQVILRVAMRLRAHSTDNGRWFHFGADEFVYVDTGFDNRHACEFANRILGAIDQPLRVGQVDLHPTASIGISLSESATDASELLERADRAMLDAKRHGGNRIIVSGIEHVSGSEGTEPGREELQVENDLHVALNEGFLELHYQPIFRRDGSIEAAEALMRCNIHGRQISPARLIPVAEKTGLIGRLGEWSIMDAARFAKKMHDRGQGLKCAVNVSRAQLLSDGFAESLAATLLLTGVPVTSLELELTESLFMDNSTAVQQNLEACQAMGFGLAIDDFGTGYSCLANLKDLPATKLKLDRAFVCVLPEDTRGYSVVRAMTMLGKELGMTVVAEGVETPEQAERLWDAGVDALQGYHLSRPMSSSALESWIVDYREQHS